MDNFQIYFMKNTLVLNSTIHQHGSCDVSLSEFNMSSSNNTTDVFVH